MTQVWDKEKIWVLDRNQTHDLPNTVRVLFSLSYENSWWARSLYWVHMWQLSLACLDQRACDNLYLSWKFSQCFYWRSGLWHGKKLNLQRIMPFSFNSLINLLWKLRHTFYSLIFKFNVNAFKCSMNSESSFELIESFGSTMLHDLASSSSKYLNTWNTFFIGLRSGERGGILCSFASTPSIAWQAGPLFCEGPLSMTKRSCLFVLGPVAAMHKLKWSLMMREKTTIHVHFSIRFISNHAFALSNCY